MPRQADYKIRVYSPTDGLLRAEIGPTEFSSFYLERTLNGIDTLTFRTDESAPYNQYFVTDAIIEVWRRIWRPTTGFAEWYIESTLFHRTPQHDLTENSHKIFISYARGLEDLLHRRNILYYANTAFTLKSGPGETVMKEFVEQNVGPSASSVLRRSNGTWVAPMLGLTVALTQGLGAVWSGARTWRNVLDTLVEIAIATGVDFSVVRTGPRTFEFRTYYPQYGTDRSATVLFDPGFNNMTNIVMVESRTEEVNAILVLGQGEESSRVMWPQSDSIAGAASPWNVIESVRDARSQSTLAALQTDATEALNELKAQENFSFKVLQTDPRQYGQNGEYWMGDIVRARYLDTDIVRKIVGVTISLNDGREDIDLEFSEFPTQSAS